MKLSEILIPLSPSATQEEAATAEKEAQDIVNRLNAGAPFEKEAREHSKGPTALQGGNVGYFSRGALAPQIETQVFNLKVGGITDPIRTKQGFTIIKVTDRTDNPPNSYRGDLDILTDTGGVDFGPYLSSVLLKIRKNWYAMIPDGAKSPASKHGGVAIMVSIRKDGTAEEMKISRSSGDPELDRAAWRAISASIPLDPLPSGFNKDLFTMRLRFYYNMDRTLPMN